MQILLTSDFMNFVSVVMLHFVCLLTRLFLGFSFGQTVFGFVCWPDCFWFVYWSEFCFWFVNRLCTLHANFSGTIFCANIVYCSLSSYSQRNVFYVSSYILCLLPLYTIISRHLLNRKLLLFQFTFQCLFFHFNMPNKGSICAKSKL